VSHKTSAETLVVGTHAHSLLHGMCADCVLQVESERVCQTGLEEEAELQWKQDQQAALAPCQNIKHTFARIARECKDVHFFSINVSLIAQPWPYPGGLCPAHGSLVQTSYGSCVDCSLWSIMTGFAFQVTVWFAQHE
jgi:hypothetical protein